MMTMAANAITTSTICVAYARHKVVRPVGNEQGHRPDILYTEWERYARGSTLLSFLFFLAAHGRRRGNGNGLLRHWACWSSASTTWSQSDHSLFIRS